MEGLRCDPELWGHFSYEKTSKTSKFRDLVLNFVHLSIPGGRTNRDVVEQIAKEAHIPVESLSDELNQPVDPGSRAIFGFAGDEFDKIAHNYDNMEWWVSDTGLNMAIASPANSGGLAQWRREQEDIAIQKARDILNSRPGWAQSQLALTQAEEDFGKTLHLGPWQRALNYYRATGEAWLEIVSDNETLQAFYTILPVIMEGVYWKCLGITPETFRATSPPALQFERNLLDGDKDFRKRAAERAIRAAHSEKGKEPPDAELEKRATARSAWLDQKLTQHPDLSSDVDIAAHGGPSYNTIQRYRSGATSTRDLSVRKAIAKAFQCEITEVPE